MWNGTVQPPRTTSLDPCQVCDNWHTLHGHQCRIILVQMFPPTGLPCGRRDNYSLETHQLQSWSPHSNTMANTATLQVKLDLQDSGTDRCRLLFSLERTLIETTSLKLAFLCIWASRELLHVWGIHHVDVLFSPFFHLFFRLCTCSTSKHGRRY